MQLVQNIAFASEGYSMNEQEIAMMNKLEALREKHRNLDDAIAKLGENQTIDELQLRRLKKDKLQIRDQIAMIEDMMYPDIIA